MTQPSESVRRRAKEIFEEVVELSRAERAEAVVRLCGGDEGLRGEVESLLGAHDEAESFMDGPTMAPRAGGAESGTERFEDVGSRIGPYHLLERLGEGGFGVVYLAEQEHPVRRRVALKLIKLGMDTRQVVARFEAERQALALMDHPNIARVYEAGATPAGRPYFVMELVKGVPITAWCDQHRLPLRQRLELFAGVCQAVQHAHQKGIIHRDIKPSNVLVSMHDERPVPKVIDFGIAKATDARLTEQTVFTEQRQLIGTPEYMSPEQAEMAGAAADIDTRSDVYSLGVLLYELLTGTTPFDGRELRSKAFAEMQRTIREVEPPRPSTRLSQIRDALASVAANRNTEPSRLSSTIRGELDWIVMKCLEKDRSRRYQTAAALAADLAHYLADEPVSAAAPSRAYLLRKFARRHRLFLGMGAAVLGALVVGLVLATWGFVEARRERDAAVEARNEAEAARLEAEAANADAKAVNEFLTKDLLGAADPAVHLGRDMTVREALDKASQTVADRFRDRPRVEATVRDALALTYYAAGRTDLGVSHAIRALELRRKALGDEHPETLSSVNNLGLLLKDQGKLAEAERLYRDALEKRRRVLGPDHPDTLTSISNLGLLLRVQGRFTEAEALYREAYEMRRVLGEGHPATLTLINNLAGLLRAQGRHAEAEPLFREALEAKRRVLGEDHPSTLLSLNNYGLVLDEQHKSAEAEPVLREALEKSRRVLGKDHPDTMYALNNLGRLLVGQGRNAEAELLYREALEAKRRVLGEDHPSALISAHNLGVLLHTQERLAEAEPLLREALERRRRVLGEEHPATLDSLHTLAVLFVAQGKLAEAEPLMREALERRRRVLGEEHPATLVSFNGLGSLLLGHGRLVEAEPLLAKAYWGAQNSATQKESLRYARDYGALLVKLGKSQEGLPLLLLASEATDRDATPYRPSQRRIYQAIAEAYEQLGRPAEAEPWRARLAALDAPATAPATNPAADVASATRPAATTQAQTRPAGGD